jgi:hypothetical protein
VASQSALGLTIPMWTSSIVASQDGHTDTYQMVGQNPQIALSDPTTTIVANVIPIILKFAHRVTLDPTTESCGETMSPLDTTLRSPIFNNTTFSPGGTTVGDTQYGDAFQRANFWKYTNPGGINPGYHILLTPKLGKTITVRVPARKGSASGGSCGSGQINGSFAIAKLMKIFPRLSREPWGVSPTTLPIFLLHNVSIEGAAGVHGAFSNAQFGYAPQTFVFASYFEGCDVCILSHEVGEWMDDPMGANPTPSWGNTGQVGIECQANLEVGDPLTGTNFPVPLNGFTYHLQELAFFSWFYGQVPSIGVNGAYSFNDTFTSYAPTCPPGGP